MVWGSGMQGSGGWDFVRLRLIEGSGFGVRKVQVLGCTLTYFFVGSL